MKRKESTIQAMWRTIQMWWLMRHLQDYCLALESHEFEIDDRGKHAVRQTSFTAHIALNQVIRIKGIWINEGESIPCPSCDPEITKSVLVKKTQKK